MRLLCISIEEDGNKAFELFLKAGDNYSIIAQAYLANIIVMNMYLTAKLTLGYCYVNGIGTGINKGKGFELCN